MFYRADERSKWAASLLPEIRSREDCSKSDLIRFRASLDTWRARRFAAQVWTLSWGAPGAPWHRREPKMNDTVSFCLNNRSHNLTGTSCLSSTTPSDSLVDIATFMHIFPTIYGILCSVGVIANGLVIYAVAVCKKKMVSDIYVLNLAIADMLFLLVMPFNIHQLVRDRQWVFGNFMCKAVVVVDVSNQFTTVGIVTVLCIDR